MLDALALPFMRRALEAGLLLSAVASYLGVFVVQRGLGFFGDGLAHAAFGGVALGILLGAQPLWVAIPFTLVTALLIVWVRGRTALKYDTAIGVFFAVAMALGIIFLSLREQYTRDAFTYLFGSILAVTPADLWIARALAVASLLLLPCWGRWAYATVDPELAQADRLPTLRDDYALAGAIAVTVVIAVKIVGMVLVAAFLVIPAAAARLFTRRFATMTVLSLLIGVASVLAGLWISYQRDLPTGPAIILVQAAFFAVGVAVAIVKR